MNGSIDDKEFEKYLQRGSAVSQRYRALDSEEVPPDVDAAVLERAAEAIREPLARKRRAWRRWSVPVALAASAVLAISIVLESGVRHEVAVTSAPQPASAEQQARTSASSPRAESTAERDDAASARDEMRQLEAREAASTAERAEEARQRTLAPRAPAPPPPVQSEREAAFAATNHIATPPEPKLEAPGDELDRAAPTTTTAYQPVDPLAQRHVAPAVPAAMSPPPEQDAAASVANAPPPAAERDLVSDQERKSKAGDRADPEEWLRRIRALRQAGEGEQADREWQAFRDAFPRYPVAEDDRALPLRPN